MTSDVDGLDWHLATRSGSDRVQQGGQTKPHGGHNLAGQGLKNTLLLWSKGASGGSILLNALAVEHAAKEDPQGCVFTTPCSYIRIRAFVVMVQSTNKWLTTIIVHHTGIATQCGLLSRGERVSDRQDVSVEYKYITRRRYIDPYLPLRVDKDLLDLPGSFPVLRLRISLIVQPPLYVLWAP